MPDVVHECDGEVYVLRSPEAHPFGATILTNLAGLYGWEHGDHGADRRGFEFGDAPTAADLGADLLQQVWGCLEIAYDNRCASPGAPAGGRQLTKADLGLILTRHGSGDHDDLARAANVVRWQRYGHGSKLLAVSVDHPAPHDTALLGVVTALRSSRPDRQHRRKVSVDCWLHRCCDQVQPVTAEGD